MADRSSSTIITTERWSRLLSLPGEESRRALESVAGIIQDTGGIVLLTECSLRLLATVTLVCEAAGGRVVVSSRDSRQLKELRDGLLEAAVSASPLFFHGDFADLKRDLHLAPTLVLPGGGRESITPRRAMEPAELRRDVHPAPTQVPPSGGRQSMTPRRVMDLAELVPVGVRVLWPEELGAPPHAFFEAGRFSAAPSAFQNQAGWLLLRATPARTGLVAGLPPDAFAEVKQSLDDKYFALGELSAAEYTPVAAETRAARLNTGIEQHHQGWPYRRMVKGSLPDTLPDGRPWPRISIVTPSFNQGEFIEQTILSVLNQGYPNVEHIVMDGGSTDDTARVLERYADRLAHVSSEKDGGQANAINKAMDFATGEILTWLNSDDMLAPGALFSVALAFATSSADVVAGVCMVHRDGKCIERHLTSCHDGPLSLEELLDLDGSWNAGRFYYQPEVMFTRDIWDRAGGALNEDLYYSMDYDLWVRFAQEGAKLHVISSPIAWFRQHERQKTADEAKFHSELLEYREGYVAARKLTLTFAPKPAETLHRLRVSMVNDFGYDYGAGIAHQRIAQSFLLAGHDVQVIALKHDEFGLQTPSHNLDPLLELVGRHNPHLIITGNLHRTDTDPLLLGKLAELAPTFSVLHDFWILTGRCAYAGDCEKYRTGCDETCPTPNEYPALAPDKIAGAWERKRDLLASTNAPGLFACSDWAAGFARGALADVDVERVKLGVPVDTFHPMDPATARSVLGLPRDRFIVLVSGSISDPRKGIRDVVEAVRILDLPDLLVAVAGAARLDEEFGIESIVHLGYLDTPERLALAYSAADLFVGASREETFGQAFVEAAACGTPVIGYAVSAVPEAVAPGISGSLAAELTPEALAAEILDCYRSPDRRSAMAHWGAILMANEWSLESSYLSFLRALRRRGLTAEWRLAPKITFLPKCPAPPPVLNPFDRDLNAVVAHDLSAEENPIPQYEIGPYRWAFGPATRLTYRSSEEGPHTLFVKYRNPHPDQQVKLICNGNEYFNGPLPCTGYEEARLLIAEVVLRAGKNELRLEFARWNQGGVDPRPLAMMVEQFHLAPADGQEAPR